MLNDALIIDEHQDTLLYSGKVKLGINAYDFEKRNFKIGSLGLFNSYVLQRDQNSKCYISDQNNQQINSNQKTPNSIKNFEIDKKLLFRTKEKLIYRSLIQPLEDRKSTRLNSSHRT